MQLQFLSRETSGVAALDTGIKAVSVAVMDGAPVVFASGGSDAGVSVYRLSGSGRLALHDSARLAPSRTVPLARDSAVIGTGDDAVLLLGAGAGGILAYELAGDGRIDALRAPVSIEPAPAPVDRLAFLPDAGGGGRLALSGSGVHDMDPAGDVTRLAGPSGPGLATGLIEGAAGPVLIRATAEGVESLGAGGVRLAPLDVLGSAQGLGLAAPTALETVAAHGTRFAILGDAGTGALSVLEVGADGALHFLDHLIDSRSSRFADLQDVAVARVADHVFVVAGGSDDGLSLFTLLPDGRLIHLDSIASADAARLDGITRLAATHAQDALHVFVATQGDAGLAHLSVPMGGIGQVLRGTGKVAGGAGDDIVMGQGAGGTLSGGAGDDILVAGPAGGTLTGGPGADIFVMQGGGGEVAITDFDAGSDQLDLSDYSMLRGPEQLGIAPLSDGARITFRDEVIVIDSHDGAPLTGAELFGRVFDGPDRLSVFTGERVLAPEPPPDPDPAPPPNPDPPQDRGRGIVIRPQEADPRLIGADILFTPDAESAGTITFEADATGRFDLSAVAGQSGHVQIVRANTDDTPGVGVSDALDALRLAVGLEPSFGPAAAADRIAADFDRDGAIGVDDALDVLRHAVGLPTEREPQWLFLDPGADLSAAASGTAPLPEGRHLSVPASGGWEFEMTAILTGDVAGGV